MNTEPSATGGPFSGMPCLRQVEASTLRDLERRAAPRTYKKGTVLGRQGGETDGSIVLLEGLVKLVRTSGDGQQQTLWTLGPGDCFCFGPPATSHRSPYTAICITDSRVVRMGGRSWSAVLGRQPGVNADVLDCFAGRVTELAELAEGLATRSVRERVETFLAQTARRRGELCEDGVLLKGGVTHDEIASACGTAREVVSRILGELQAEGIVKTGRGRITILDDDRLQGSPTA